MSTTSLIALGIATLVAFKLLFGLVVLSFLTGAFYFLFGKKKYEILRTQNGENGFAFGFRWNQAQEPARFDRVQIRLYNPFGQPTQLEVTKQFDPQGSDFAVDLDMGPGYKTLLGSKDFDKGRVTLTISSSRDQIFHAFEMKATQFKSQLEDAKRTAKEFNEAYTEKPSRPIYATVSRSFISDPLPEADKKVLKIASNPIFAEMAESMAKSGDGATSGGGENFAASKVWIEPGCIVCNACEDIYPEVFDVQDETCVIRPGAPLDNGLRIQEAAEACPVEVIKFTKAG